MLNISGICMNECKLYAIEGAYAAAARCVRNRIPVSRGASHLHVAPGRYCMATCAFRHVLPDGSGGGILGQSIRNAALLEAMNFARHRPNG